MAAITPGLASLSARPPTPPKESSNKLANGSDLCHSSILASRPLLDTPDESPSSSAEYPKSSAEDCQKKVGFSPWTDIHRFPLAGSKDSDSDGSIRRLPPSRDCKSLKSILKACNDNTTFAFENEPSIFDQPSLSTMFRSTIQNLATASRTSRIDAYMSLFAYLSAYDDASATPDLSANIVDFTDCIRRDVNAKIGSENSPDIQLVTQALKVLTILIYTPSTASLLPEGFCSFILDRSLSSLEDTSAPKILVAHYMHLLEKQKFSSKIVTAERVARLLTVLAVVTHRIKGNRVVCHRLMIYQRLMRQAKSVMTARVGLWVDPLISGMLSSIKDVRVRAIGFGIEASLQLGTISSVSNTCNEVFNRASPEGKKVIEFLSSRLMDMVDSKEDAVHVPQLWSIVILFLRSRRRQLECWQHIKAWLVIIQRCLNSSEPQVKFQANIAWSRLIFVVNPDCSTSPSMTKMLRQPIMSQLERKGTDKISKHAKQIARSTYCTLLYYAFRPSATHAQLDQYWDLYIAQVLPVSFLASKSDLNHACDIFAALLSSRSKPRIWKHNRANVSGPVKPDELPCIDPKWIRSNAATVTQTYQKLFELSDWTTNKANEAPVLLAWRSFMTAIGTASSKEIKVSMETMNAVAQIVNLIKRLLEKENQQRGSDHADSSDIFLKVNCLMQEAIASIGSIPFLERRMVLTSHNFFEAAGTPSSRSIKDPDTLDSPVTHLLQLLLMYAPSGKVTTSYADLVKTVMHISLQTATIRRTQLSVLCNIARLLSSDIVFDRQASFVFWRILAEATCSSLRLPRHNDPHNASPQYPGQEYREATKILILGIQQRAFDITATWLGLYNCITTSVQEEIGNDGISLLITEPLADIVRTLSSDCDEVLFVLAITLLKDLRWPQSQNSLERAEKLLWGVVHTPQKSKYDAPFGHIFDMANKLLISAYEKTANFTAESIYSYLSCVTIAIGSCPLKYQECILSQIQNGLAVWIEDPDGKMKSTTDAQFLIVNRLWAEVVIAIEEFHDYNTRLLFRLQYLLLSGLRSRHKSLVNKAVQMWNGTFGCAKGLEYPENMRESLLKLRSLADLQLPSFVNTEIDEEILSPIHFLTTQDGEVELQALWPTNSHHRKEPENRRTHIHQIPAPLPQSPNSKPTPDSARSARREHKSTPRARLRHDDSQIQFAAVESSPLAELNDSQQLTDRQKEVKKRQAVEAAMFPEIRSSPKSAQQHTKYILPKLIFKTQQNGAETGKVDEQISPTDLPDICMTDFLGSSPTTAYSKKGASTIHLDKVLPPSSPPSRDPQSIADQEIGGFKSTDNSVQPGAAVQDYNRGNLTDRDLLDVITRSSASKDLNVTSEVLQSPEILENKSKPVAQANKSDDCPMSDFDVFVDAPSEPNQKVPVTKEMERCTVFDFIQSGRFSQQPSEADQVTAQIVSEMERASSQQSSKQAQATTPVAETGRKRKGTFSDSINPEKKVKSTGASPKPQNAMETPRAREFVADCVLINVRQAEGSTAVSPVQVKSERSKSPSLIVNTPLEKEAQSTQRQSKQPIGKPWVVQTSQDASSYTQSPQRKKSSVTNSSESSRRKSARLNGSSMTGPRHSAPPLELVVAEPGSVTKRGRRKASKRWFWSRDESRDDNSQSGTNADVAIVDANNVEMAAGHDQPEASQQLAGEPEATRREPQDTDCQMSPTRQANRMSHSEASDADLSGSALPSPEGILQGFRRMVNNLRRIPFLGREEEREMIGVLFESVKEVHEAGRRKTAV